MLPSILRVRYTKFKVEVRGFYEIVFVVMSLYHAKVFYWFGTYEEGDSGTYCF